MRSWRLVGEVADKVTHLTGERETCAVETDLKQLRAKGVGGVLGSTQESAVEV